MCSLKTLIYSFAVASSLNGAPASALDEQQQLQIFATCAGRLSAVMEFQWMFDGAASENTAIQRAGLLDLIEAIMPPDYGREVLQWRLSAKAAQSALLTRAAFNQDPQDAAWAQTASRQQTAECASLLLS